MRGSLQINNNVEATNPKISNIDTLILFICVIDTLFFPYIRVASASLSMILLPIWYIFNLKKIKKSFEFQLFMILAFFVILSVALSTISFPIPMVLKSNIANSMILLYGFLYYFFYKYYFEVKHAPIKKLLMLYTSFGLTLCATYMASPSLYFEIRSFWTMGGNVIEITDSLSIFRFTSTFSDPNNAAVAFVAVLTFLLFNQKTTFTQRMFAIIATALILIATMSSTGIILFIISLLFYIARLFPNKKYHKFNRSTLLDLAMVFILSPILFWIIYKFLGSEVAQMSLDRFSSNSTDSRIELWKELLNRENIFYYLIYGMGGTLIVDGFLFRPHNGHLHLIYSYGMIAYAIFMYVFFRKRKNTTLQSYFFLVPFFLGFTMNVGIYEPRFITLLSLLLASYASINKPNFDTMRQQYPLKGKSM